ncbi:bifunctional riboflavin kinase/FAD synthetase [Pelagibacterium montanilacus]|uniref:bifunctional riboflavin kinase/FAD synthetase n=1 Tax=Pelagibacterium montanilacus TaxID=2185280 RepID=UPI000F8E14BB|nr:bifunctional riboflavin kinase/FAD synthetase [Pelagibacterium montanilacus]
MTSGSSFVRLNGLDAVPAALRGGVVAIGNFDGCHLGHQRVFDAARKRARANGAPLLALTFEPHPRDVFAPEPFMYRLTDADAKAALFAALGFDGLVVMPFSRDLAGVEATDFVGRYLIDALGVAGVAVGADFHFGKGRAGTPDFLRAQGSAHGFGVDVLEMLDDGTAAISSSRIREALSEGEVETANGLLGYRHFLTGTVVEGDRRGRTLGYPTANVPLPANCRLAQGVYAVRVRLGDAVHSGVAAYGKPMFDNSAPPFETFIFDFDRDIYGQHLEIALLAHLRGQMRFDGLDALVAQMGWDAERARAIIAEAVPLSPLDGALGFVG